jgi:hypothetical protein
MKKQKPTKLENLERLLNDIYSSSEMEISPTEADLLMRRCADLLLSAESARSQFPQLFRYFELYPSTRAEFDLLMEMVRAEAADEIPELKVVPARPNKVWPGLGQLNEFISAVFGGFRLAGAVSAVRGNQPHFAPGKVQLNHGAVVVGLDLQPGGKTPGNWNLTISVNLAEEPGQANLEFSPVRLMPLEGDAEQEQALDEFGGALFTDLAAGNYLLELSIGGVNYQIKDVVIPELK